VPSRSSTHLVSALVRMERFEPERTFAHAVTLSPLQPLPSDGPLSCGLQGQPRVGAGWKRRVNSTTRQCGSSRQCSTMGHC
jgi:hypothetical protein